MYRNILKKDLKRKKTMNVILLLFVLLAVTFVSASVNNMLAVTNALDGYFEKAGAPDYMVATRNAGMGEGDIMERAQALDCVTSCKNERCLYLNNGWVTREDGGQQKLDNTGIMSALEEANLQFLKGDNSALNEVKPGELYLAWGYMEKSDVKKGDVLTFHVGDRTLPLTVAGDMKDALLGSSNMGSPRFLVCKSDFDLLYGEQEAAPWRGTMVSIMTTDLDRLEKVLGACNANIVFMAPQQTLRISYIMDMLIAGVLLIVSVCLILIAFVILRFTIVFTLTEEFREIGVMKAIGIRNWRIRNLYLIKYFAISTAGALIGFFTSIPFGKLFLDQVSKNIPMEQTGGIWVNLLCALLVIGIVMLFCYTCTGKLRKFTPVDAIRSGANGERYRGKGIFSLGKGHIRPIWFLAGNDIFSNLKRYAVMLLTFTLGMILIIVPINTMNTLRSEKILPLCSVIPKDLYMCSNTDGDQYMTHDGRTVLREDLAQMEEKLADNGMPADCSMEMIFKYSLTNGEYSCNSLAFQGTNTQTWEYAYMEGTPPENPSEIAISHIVSERLHAGVGDTVEVAVGGKTKAPYMISAVFQSMNNMGEGVRLHEDAQLDYAQAIGCFAYQIEFRDNPGNKALESRKAEVGELYPDMDVLYGGEYTDKMVGGIAGQLSGIRNLIVVVVVVINCLVAVLMEKAFLTKEKGEIAMLKAVGFRNNAIAAWQTIRIGIVLLLASVVGALLSNPVGQVSSGAIFRMMGASSISFDIRPLEVYLLYPLLVFAATIIASFITAQQIRRISASETNTIE